MQSYACSIGMKTHMPTKTLTQPKVQMLCATCHSPDVSRDAWGDLDVGDQEWGLRTVFDYAHCHTCDGETRLIEIALD